jgi:N-acetylglucosaminyldiphosphoundecaprenol N-acetyl-beta-D-mannosaminyltransferase
MMRTRVEVLGHAVDRLDLNGAVARCRDLIDARDPAAVVFVNAAKVVAGRRDRGLRASLERSALVLADGMPVVWASRLLGDPLPERVTGIDLLGRLLGLAEERGYRVYVLGARADVLERAIENIRARHPGLVVAGRRDGYFTDGEYEEVAAEIRAARPDILFVAMSSPRKEYWIDRQGPGLGVPLLMGVGGSIDVWAEVVGRAPAWMQRSGLEWLYRLVQEPRRLWRRYLVTNTIFLGLLGKELARRRLRRTRFA